MNRMSTSSSLVGGTWEKTNASVRNRISISDIDGTQECQSLNQMSTSSSLSFGSFFIVTFCVFWHWLFYVLYDFLSFINIHLFIIILYIFLRKAWGTLRMKMHYTGCWDLVLMKITDVNKWTGCRHL